MRFDLTVPFARFAAQHISTLGTPFKRYHMGTVWRGENTQRGRYREFMQCDFDTIGTTSAISDLETVLVVHDLLASIGIDKFTIRINDRRILSGILEVLGLTSKTTHVLRCLDKTGKIPRDTLAKELQEQGVSVPSIDRLLGLGELAGSATDVLNELQDLVGFPAYYEAEKDYFFEDLDEAAE